MYVPPLYHQPDGDRPREVVSRYPLAALVSNGPSVPHVTHLPVVPAPDSPSDGPLTDSVLLGHMNRANPHWAALALETPGRLIFTGPQSYITPAVYRTTPAAPTWDFVVVHLIGSVQPLSGIDATLEVVTRTAEVFERSFGAAWDLGPSLDYFRSIAPGVGAFRFRTTAVECMFKLSQEKDDGIRRRVVDWLSASGSGAARDLAPWMRSCQAAAACSSSPAAVSEAHRGR